MRLAVRLARIILRCKSQGIVMDIIQLEVSSSPTAMPCARKSGSGTELRAKGFWRPGLETKAEVALHNWSNGGVGLTLS